MTVVLHCQSIILSVYYLYFSVCVCLIGEKKYSLLSLLLLMLLLLSEMSPSGQIVANCAIIHGQFWWHKYIYIIYKPKLRYRIIELVWIFVIFVLFQAINSYIYLRSSVTSPYLFRVSFPTTDCQHHQSYWLHGLFDCFPIFLCSMIFVLAFFIPFIFQFLTLCGRD